MKLSDMINEIQQERKNINKLYEGLIITNPIESTVDIISGTHKIHTFSYIKIKNNKIIITLDLLPKYDLKQNMFYYEELERMMNNLGWFSSIKILDPLGKKIKINNVKQLNKELIYFKKNNYVAKIYFQYEAKYDLEQDYIGVYYHVTDLKYLEKINKIGLVPKTKNKLVKHPDRIYLVKNYEYAKKLKLILKLDNPVVLKINTHKMVNLRIFLDPNYKGGVYTLQNIPPKAITVLKEK